MKYNFLRIVDGDVIIGRKVRLFGGCWYGGLGWRFRCTEAGELGRFPVVREAGISEAICVDKGAD